MRLWSTTSAPSSPRLKKSKTPSVPTTPSSSACATSPCALGASRRAVDLAQQRYDRGLTDFLNVLDAERQLYELQDQYAVAQEDVVVQFIALYKGLGGGWEEYQNIPPLRKSQPAIVATVREVVAPENPEK